VRFLISTRSTVEYLRAYCSLPSGPVRKHERQASSRADNPDQTARNSGALLNAAGIPRSDTVRWNILPWYDSRRAKISASDLSCGAGYLLELIALLPHLRVIVFVGRRAQQAARMVMIPAGVKVVNCPHPSPLNLNADRRQRPAIRKELKAVAAILRE
jgi:uracil-DNA glycosylase